METLQVILHIIRHPSSHIKICLAITQVLVVIPGVVVDLMSPEPTTRRPLHSLAAGLSDKIRLVDLRVH